MVSYFGLEVPVRSHERWQEQQEQQIGELLIQEYFTQALDRPCEYSQELLDDTGLPRSQKTMPKANNVTTIVLPNHDLT